MKTYLDSNFFLETLKQKYNEHGKIILAFDFDNTIKPFHSDSCDEVVELIKEMRPYAHLICFTAREIDQLGEVEQYLNDNNIPFDYINKEWDGKEIVGKKIYFNVLIDDKSGLAETYSVLKQFLEYVKHKELQVYVDKLEQENVELREEVETLGTEILNCEDEISILQFELDTLESQLDLD